MIVAKVRIFGYREHILRHEAHVLKQGHVLMDDIFHLYKYNYECNKRDIKMDITSL